jgi:DNA repair exonuclease SbcCD ATPase subunit
MKKKLETDMKELSDKIIQQEITLREFRDKIYVLELIKASTSSKGYIKERINLFIELMNNQLDKISNQIMGGETGIWIVRTEKNNFEVMIQDTKGQLSYSNLSAGTKQRVDILLALALNLAIKTLTGIDINMLFFDEIFSNIDSQGRKDIENLLQRISNKFPDKMIITVLHGNDISSNHTILVTRENYQSKLSWA